MVVGLVLFHSYTGYGVDRRALRLMQWGIGLFLIAVPIDILNHRINGLDITSWSPSHALLYLGTAVMLAGAIRGWWLYAAPGRIRDLVSLGLWLFFVENALFPNQHQEYGVLSVRAFDAGQSTAEPQLLDFAASQGASPLEFALPVPSWVHPAWLICAGLLSLLLARKVVGLRWTATIIAAAYLAYRAVTGARAWSRSASRRRCCRWSCSSARSWSTSPSPAGCPAGSPARSSRARSTASASSRSSSVCCRPGTGGRRCRSRWASACCGPRSTCSPGAPGWPGGRVADEPAPAEPVSVPA